MLCFFCTMGRSLQINFLLMDRFVSYPIHSKRSFSCSNTLLFCIPSTVVLNPAKSSINLPQKFVVSNFRPWIETIIYSPDTNSNLPNTSIALGTVLSSDITVNQGRSSH